MSLYHVEHGDCLPWLRTLDAASVDAVVSDVPSGIAFMGAEWDKNKGGRRAWIDWMREVLAECLRVTKPGGWALIWALPRTSHWTGTALEEAGWQVRDQVYHIFGSGFPKSQDASKALDKAAGAQREIIGPATRNAGQSYQWGGEAMLKSHSEQKAARTAPATEAAQRWDGYGTALKPAAEVWWLARAPMAGTLARNIEEHGAGALNLDGCRVGTNAGWSYPNGPGGGPCHKGGWKLDTPREATKGRWPPHLLLTHSAECGKRCAPGCPVQVMDEQSGIGTNNKATKRRGAVAFSNGDQSAPTVSSTDHHGGAGGGASRFFPRFRYSPKPSSAERNAGCEHLEARQPVSADKWTEQDRRRGEGVTRTPSGNHHPTLKGIDLMRWLVRLVLPPGGGLVLDPFTGSGTTGIAALLEGGRFLGCEQDADYQRIALARLAHWAGVEPPEEVIQAKAKAGKPHQRGLFDA